MSSLSARQKTTRDLLSMADLRPEEVMGLLRLAVALKTGKTVADAGGIMPPKSTWFEPKLADGMVSHLLD